MYRRRVINRESPRIQVTMDWGANRPLGTIDLFIRRVGDPTEFAAYPAISEDGGVLLFQFDDLLFVREQGRYECRLLIGAKEYGRFQIEYRDTVRVAAVENADNV